MAWYAELTTAPSLTYLDISSNQLSSTLPPDWTSNLGLALFKLDHNQLTGELTQKPRPALKSC